MEFVVLMITVVRLPLALGVAALVLGCSMSHAAMLTSLFLLCIAEITDMLDGALARHYRVVTRRGAFIDPYIDSVSRLIVCWSFAQVGYVWSAVPLVMAVRDITVAYCRIALAPDASRLSARFSGKIKAWVQALGSILVLAGVAFLERAEPAITSAVSITVIGVTALSSVEYIGAAIKGPGVAEEEMK